jgi:alpha-N-arabinofuranosidase
MNPTARRPIALFLALGWILFAAAGLCAAPTGKGAAMKTFRNPVLPGFHPDPSVCRVGQDFYLVNSTFEYFPGLPIYRSRDLVHWEHVGNALDRPSQLPLKGATDTGGLYAPTIRHHQGVFHLTCTNVTGGGNFIVTAKDPAGPWSEPVWVDVPDIDGSMFFDDDGKLYFTNQGGGDWAGIKQVELDPKTFRPVGKSRVVWNDKTQPWNEGPHLYKIHGKYYLMLAEGGTGSAHAEYIGRSDSPWGPFEPCPHNPILTHRDVPGDPIQCTGHADLVEAPDGSWWAVFLATRPEGGWTLLGRETFLAPVTWDANGWPVVGKERRVALEMTAPALKPCAFASLPSREEFGAEKLGPEWVHVRNIDLANISLTRRKGFLSLSTAAPLQDDRGSAPAFAGKRQPSHRMTARCRMDFRPVRDGEEAGLSVRANDAFHYDVGVGRFGDGPELFVRNRVKGGSSLVARRKAPAGALFLEVQCTGAQYQFAFSADGKAWEPLAASDAADLSRERAGGFTGAVVGLYAASADAKPGAWADFDWFEMREGSKAKARPLSARPTPTPVPSRDTWRVQAGGPGRTDSAGNVWSADMLFDAGEIAVTDRPMKADRDPELFQTERWGSDLTYAFPVPPGKYRVRLYFSETYVKKQGERVFDVLVNGERRIADLDILKESGATDRGLVKTLPEVSPDPNGMIRVRFIAKVQNAKICAIEVTPKR